ncbi:sigma-70 family RNA polymerase sigma factor [Nocardioides dongxiaopingii]|uniref:sigma-70 family RNA polymerase sigma factor n=1 Tax=Nocardioides dongxiaopingii TaxID=2576036 RepID=UPI0010C76EF2|nr:sigma-70 family RNA polymerase sigma factor [Nocardioides dongxiaopingii]
MLVEVLDPHDVHPDPELSRTGRSELTHDLLTRAHATDDPVERERLLDEVIVANLRVAHAVAARYRGRGVALDDLEQAACEGLVKAVHRFDPAQRHDLLSYAVPTIRGEVLHHFRNHSWTLRPPRRIQDLQWRINRAADDLSARLGREPLTAEVCEALEITPAEHDEAVAAFGCFQPTSLDQEIGGTEQLTLGESIPDVTDHHDATEARTLLTPVVRRLSDRDRRILYLRFFEDQTQQEIGEELGVPQTQVSRWLGRICRDLRSQLAG